MHPALESNYSHILPTLPVRDQNRPHAFLSFSSGRTDLGELICILLESMLWQAVLTSLKYLSWKVKDSHRFLVHSSCWWMQWHFLSNVPTDCLSYKSLCHNLPKTAIETVPQMLFAWAWWHQTYLLKGRAWNLSRVLMSMKGQTDKMNSSNSKDRPIWRYGCLTWSSPGKLLAIFPYHRSELRFRIGYLIYALQFIIF